MKSKLLQLLLTALFVLGTMAVNAQTYASGNLLVNPGCEAPAATGTTGTDDGAMPTGWDKVPNDWFSKYYSSFTSPLATSTYRGEGATTNNGNPFFSGANNGVSIIGVLSGNFAGRFAAAQTNGMRQTVSVTPGATYVFGCKIGIKATNPQTIKGTEGVKIINPEDNTILDSVSIGETYAPASTDPAVSIVRNLEKRVTIPPGINQIFFQVENVDVAITKAPLVCFDECFFRKVQPNSNLLVNPGFEDPNSGQTSDLLPAPWQAITAINWFKTYYSDDNLTGFSNANCASIYSNVGVQTFFTGANNGVPIADLLMGNYCGRLTASNSSGMYQLVDIETPGNYKISVRIAYTMTAANQEIKNNTVKVLSADGLITYGEVPIPIDNQKLKTAYGFTGANQYFISPFIVTGIVTIPEGVPQVRFQLDQRDWGTSPGPRAPLMLFDDCDFYKVPDFVIEAEGDNAVKTKSDYISGDYGDIVFQSKDNSTGQLIIPEGDDLTANGVVKLQKTFASEKKWYPIGFPFDVASVRSDADGYDDYDLATYNDPDNLNSSYDGSGDYWLKTYDADKDEFIYYPSGSENIAQGGYILEVPNPFLGSTFTFTSGTGVVLSNSDVLDIEENFYKLTNNPSVANLPVINDAQNNFYAFGVKFPNNFGLLSSAYTLKPFESLVVANNQTELRSDLGTGEITSSPSLNLPNDNAVATEYYNLLGVKVAEPVKGNIYLVKTIYKSGKTSVVKQYINHN